MTVAMVRLDKVAKRYGPVVALAGVDLEVRAGEFITMLGPSGSGKTTLLNMIAGTVAPTEGRVWINGADATDVPTNRRGLGMVFQNYALMPHMDVFENVAFPLRIRRAPEAEIRARVADALAMVRLPDYGRRKPKELSGGQQQRVAIARSLVYRPSLILMDEPLGALDKKLRDQMQVEIKQLHAKLGTTILYVTHDQQEALVMSDRICLMNGGRIEQLGPPDELYFRPATSFAADFLGESNLIAATVAAADAAGVAVRLADGRPLQADAAPGVAVGDAVAVMIRPESIRVLAPGERADNEIEAIANEVLLTGSVTRLIARSSGDLAVSASFLTDRSTTAIGKGIAVRLGWARRDAIVIRSKERVGRP